VIKTKKEFISNIDYNKSASVCFICAKEYEKINRRVNKRKLSEIETKEVPHILKVFNY